MESMKYTQLRLLLCMLTLDTMLKHIRVKDIKDKAIKVKAIKVKVKDIMVRNVEILKRSQFVPIVDSWVI